MAKFKMKYYQYGAEDWMQFDDLLELVGNAAPAIEWNVYRPHEVYLGEWMILNSEQLSEACNAWAWYFMIDPDDSDYLAAWEMWRKELERLNKITAPA